MRAMLTALSSARARALSVAFVVAAGGVTLGARGPRAAYAQPKAPVKDRNDDRKEREEKERAAAAEQPAPSAAPSAAPARPDAPAEFGEVEAKKAVYFSGDIAFTRSDLGVVNDLGFDRTVANGFLYGLSTGLRLSDLRVGVRWRVYDTTEFILWNFSLSAGYGLPIRPVSPIFSAHVGYVFDQMLEPALFRSSLPDGTLLPPNVDVKGLLAGIDVNASYWVTKFLRLGAFIGADVMFLSRARAAIPRTLSGGAPEVAGNALYADSGSGLGLNFNLGLRGAFDIGFK
jgi:hypothetical protein